MSWAILILAGTFEIGFVAFLKLSQGFTKPLQTAAFVACSFISFFLLNKSLSTIPIGVAYAVWTGIGAAGTVLLGHFLFNDVMSTAKTVFICLLIVSIIGLKLS